ncbi:MAG: hypothetical protein K6C30_06465 [Bacteroidaceae bacterium]|nr:hypothetical protein [Bacteroidaceae bacterium]
MKRLFISLALAACSSSLLWASNTTTTVAQVTEAVELSSDVDYHITSTTPFTTTGSLNITNREHAVVIFDNLRPSNAKKQLGYIQIDGVAAESGKNCQLRMYDRGTILFPYGAEGVGTTSFHPLVVYDEKGCAGNSYEAFGLEHSGGFMNTLTEEKMNNKIRSFTLKRGYMVTFSTGSEGGGYSRCFIADAEDLTVNSLPSILDQRISSYRIFRWADPGKAGVADMLSTDNLGTLNATWSYTWGNGWDMGTDYECVSHMNHRWGPSAASMGSASYSCHIKTDNEPGNSADPEPATVDEVLDRWYDLMRTGKRLMTPSSHDGSMNWFSAFLDSIDARGWRCEILDFHCYWTEGQYNNLKGYADRYGRPIWISEFVWGASWNSNGAFASGVTEANNREVMGRILTNLNNWNWIERYAYWNGERDPSRILKNGSLTATGEFFKNMATKKGYYNYGNYVPKTPPMYAVSDLSITYNSRTGSAKYQWTNKNLDLTDMTILQKKIGSTWTNIDTLDYSEDKSRSYTTTILPSENIGLNEYRLMCIDADNKNRYSNTASIFLGGAVTYGDIMTGTIETNSTEKSTIYFATQETIPIVITGLPTNKNNANGIFNHLNTIGKDNFTFNFEPWTEGTELNFKYNESTDYIVLQPGSYNWGGMLAQVDTCEYMKGTNKSYMSNGDTIEVTFNEPFEEGVTPVVVAQNITSGNSAPTGTRIFDVTNKGFKMKLIKQAGATTSTRTQYSFYIAVTPGSAPLGDTGMRIHAGRMQEPIGGISPVANVFRDEAGDTLFLREPYILAAAQTNNLDYTSVFRKYSDITRKITDAQGEEITETYGIRIRRQMDSTAEIPTGTNTASKSGDYVGWLAIDKDPTTTGITTPALPHNQFLVEVKGRVISPSDPTARIYSSSGMSVKAGTRVAPGIYVVTNGRATTKVMVR